MSGSIRETDIILGATVPAPFTAARLPTSELHINPWSSGTKGTPSATVGTAASVAAGVGIQMVPQRLTAMSNAPAELILGESSADLLLNLVEGSVVTSVSATVSLVYTP